MVYVNDGLALASDSATLAVQEMQQLAQGDVGPNVYNNANKIFNLRKGLPIAAMTAGLGNIGTASISTLAKDLRLRFTGHAPNQPDGRELKLDSPYDMNDVVQQFKTFFYDEQYQPFMASVPNAAALPREQTTLEFIVGGYDKPPGDFPKVYKLTFRPNGCDGPNTVNPNNEIGVTWMGMGEGIYRLLMGVSGFNTQALMNRSVPQPIAEAWTNAIIEEVKIPIVSAGMPIGDALELAEFLAQVTVGYVRFQPGFEVVGGQIELAAITRHEGFKWVRRKHYFDAKLIPVSD
jgi:hypothetical protein